VAAVPAMEETRKAASSGGRTSLRTLPLAWPRSRADFLADLAIGLAAFKGIADRAAPDGIDMVEAGAEAFVEGGHFRGEIADGAAVGDEAAARFFLFDPLAEPAEDLLDGIDGVLGVGEGFHPPLVYGGEEKLVDDRVGEGVLAGEVVEEGSFGDAGFPDDVVEAAALKAVVIELPVSGFENLPAGAFWVADAGGHGVILTDRSVGGKDELRSYQLLVIGEKGGENLGFGRRGRVLGMGKMTAVLRRITNLFWLWTILGTAWAWFRPEDFTWFLGKLPGTEHGLIPLGLGVIMLGMGITLTVDDFSKVFSTPWQVAIGVVAQFAIMPFVGWGVATLFGLEDGLKLGVILVSCCPGGTASNVVCYLAQANVALSVLMTMTSTMLAVGLTPYLTKVYASVSVPFHVDAAAMVWSMVSIVLLPVLMGVVLNHFLGKKLKVVKEISPIVSVLVIVLIVGAIVGAKKDDIVTHAVTLLPAVFVMHILGFGLGYGWGKLFRISENSCRTVAIEVGMQNSGLGSSLAQTHFVAVAPLAAVPCAISAFFHCMIGSFLASVWRRRR
jgi:BASS family bile acid:Na+ symporter